MRTPNYVLQHKQIWRVSGWSFPLNTYTLACCFLTGCSLTSWAIQTSSDERHGWFLHRGTATSVLHPHHRAVLLQTKAGCEIFPCSLCKKWCLCHFRNKRKKCYRDEQSSVFYGSWVRLAFGLWISIVRQRSKPGLHVAMLFMNQKGSFSYAS